MLKNIEKMREKGLKINDNWLKWDLFSKGIPPAILKKLELRNPHEKKSKRPVSRTSRRTLSMIESTSKGGPRGGSSQNGSALGYVPGFNDKDSQKDDAALN
jgi:hypothetical protein